jgi:hypothetical protein
MFWDILAISLNYLKMNKMLPIPKIWDKAVYSTNISNVRDK